MTDLKKSEQLKQDLIASVKNRNVPLREIILGVNLTLVNSRHFGLASTVYNAADPFKKLSQAGTLKELPLQNLLDKLKSDNLLECSIGLAALNSLLKVDTRAKILNAFEIIRRKGQGKDVSVIGHFPFVERLKQTTRNCWVFEKAPRPGDLSSERMGEFLPESDVVVITGQTITNNTIGGVLRLAEKAFKIMLGPSTPLSPVLYDYGINVLGGVRVRNGPLVKKYILQGAHFRQLPGIELITMSR